MNNYKSIFDDDMRGISDKLMTGFSNGEDLTITRYRNFKITLIDGSIFNVSFPVEYADDEENNIVDFLLNKHIPILSQGGNSFMLINEDTKDLQKIINLSQIKIIEEV